MAHEYPGPADTYANADANTDADAGSASPCGASQTPPSGQDFHTTCWSLVLTAGDRQSVRQRQALETLCQRYWQPLYLYIRRKGYDVEMAEDLIQGFFARLLEKELLASARAERGRFRSFLKTALCYFMTNEWEKSRSQKRQGGHEVLSLDLESAESLYHQVSRHAQLTPDQIYARQWVRALLDNTWRRMRQEFAHRGRQEVFDRLQKFVDSDIGDDSYAQAAADLGISADAARACVCRMRNKYRALLRLEVADTVEAPEQVDEELRHLWKVFA